jgi:hypothetical protein
VVNNNYIFVKKSQIEGQNAVSKADELIKTPIPESDIDFSDYVPIYNDGAEKKRTVDAAESNYFNILQTIAEKFECWLDLEIKRDDPLNPGKITAKKVTFRNYAGDVNYAGFRYGVNLKDIQRTFTSK